MTMNEGQQEQTTRDDPPEGYYDAQAVGETEPHVQTGTTSNGNEELVIEMKLLDLNRVVLTRLNFSEAAAKFSMDRLRTLGWKGGDTMTGITANRVQLRAKIESWNDRETGEQKSAMKYEIMTGGRAVTTPMEEKEKRGFFAKLNTLYKQSEENAGKKGGYPADWDKSKTAPKASAAPDNRPPRVNLG